MEINYIKKDGKIFKQEISEEEITEEDIQAMIDSYTAQIAKLNAEKTTVNSLK